MPEDPERAEGAGEEGFWSVAADSYEQKLEKEASKIIALWELGGDFAAMKPATGEAGSDEGAWSADAAPKPVDPPKAAPAPAPNAQGGKKGKKAGRRSRKTQLGHAAISTPSASASDETPEAKAPAVAVVAARVAVVGSPSPAAEPSAPEPSAQETPEPRSEAAASEPAASEPAPEPARPATVALMSGIEIDAGFAADVEAHRAKSNPPPAPAFTRPAPSRGVGQETMRVAAVESPDSERLQLPTSNNTKLFAAAAVAALFLVGVTAAYVVFSGPDEDSERASSPSAAAAAADEPEPEPEAPAQPVVAAAEPQAAEPQADDEPAPAEPAVEAAAVEEPAVAVAPEPPPEPAPPPEPTTARVTVRTVPPNATLQRDGEDVANPFQGEIDIGSRARFSASAEGFRDGSELVRVRDADAQEIVIELRARPQPRPQPQPQPQAAAPRAPRPAVAREPRPATPREPRARSRGAGFTTDNPY
jgi:hypothetical protein